MRSFYSTDADPRGWRTPGGYWSVGTHSPLQTTIAPDSSVTGYSGLGVPGQRILNPYVTRGPSSDRSLSQYAYPMRYPKYAGYFPGGSSPGDNVAPLYALAIAAVIVLWARSYDTPKSRKA